MKNSDGWKFYERFCTWSKAVWKRFEAPQVGERAAERKARGPICAQPRSHLSPDLGSSKKTQTNTQRKPVEPAVPLSLWSFQIWRDKVFSTFWEQTFLLLMYTAHSGMDMAVEVTVWLEQKTLDDFLGYSREQMTAAVQPFWTSGTSWCCTALICGEVYGWERYVINTPPMQIQWTSQEILASAVTVALKWLTEHIAAQIAHRPTVKRVSLCMTALSGRLLIPLMRSSSYSRWQ